jgi:molybdopterin biosynthesis enzyme
MDLEGWTNDRLVLERLARLNKTEWVYGIPGNMESAYLSAELTLLRALHSAVSPTLPRSTPRTMTLPRADIMHTLERLNLTQGQQAPLLRKQGRRSSFLWRRLSPNKGYQLIHRFPKSRGCLCATM